MIEPLLFLVWLILGVLSFGYWERWKFDFSVLFFMFRGPLFWFVAWWVHSDLDIKR